MDHKYLHLRRQLNELGYTDTLSGDSIPLVENIIGDLIQTTKSLNHYMNTTKEAIQQRDQYKSATQPYKCDNIRLTKDNNQLHLDLMEAKDQLLNLSETSKTQIGELQKQLLAANRQIDALKDQCRSFAIKNVCSETISSRNKTIPVHDRLCSSSKYNNAKKSNSKDTDCRNCDRLLEDVDRLTVELTESKEENITYSRNIIYLKSQLALRDKEISRLNRLTEYGRPSFPVDAKSCHSDLMKKVITLENEITALYNKNHDLECQLRESISKRHEAMKRAIQLADENSMLEKEIRNIDRLALKLEDDCNKELKEKSEYIASLRKPRNEFIREDYFDRVESHVKQLADLKATLEETNEIKSRLVNENKKLLDANRQLELLASNLADSEAIAQLKLKKVIENSSQSDSSDKNTCNCNPKITKEEIMSILQNERKEYEKQIEEIKRKMSLTVNSQNISSKTFENEAIIEKIKEERDHYQQELIKLKNKVPNDSFLNELQHKIYELEQNVHYLKRQNETLTETNRTLKMHLDENSQQRSNRSDTMLQSSLNKLQFDLEKARSDVKNLEHERMTLRNRLQAATECNMQEVNELVSKNIRYESLLSDNRSLNSSRVDNLQLECEKLRDKLKIAETDLLHSKSLQNQLKNLQMENDKQLSLFQSQIYEAKKEIRELKETLTVVEKEKTDLDYELKLMKSDKLNLKENVSRLDQDRDKLILDLEEKNNRLAHLQQQLRVKETNGEMLENKVTELIRKQELFNSESLSMEYRLRDLQVQNESLNKEIISLTKQKDGALIENRRLQSDLSVINNDLQAMTREYEASRKDVADMKQQLQHYVDEVRRIEDLLSKKEAERTEMLDHFASLSHEATVLETNNHSLESEAANKAAQLHNTVEKVNELEIKLRSRDTLSEMQEEKITTLVYKISKLESELDQQRDANKTLEHNLACAREMCVVLENQKKNIVSGLTDDGFDKKRLEQSLMVLHDEKSKLQEDVDRLKVTVESLESLLSSSRHEAVELKLLLEDAIKESKTSKDKVEYLQKRLEIAEGEGHSSRIRTEQAAKQLQELQWQMTDERLHRHNIRTQSQPSSTL